MRSLRLIGAAVIGLVVGSVTPQAASACTLGVCGVQNGYCWCCESCGSETCEIMKPDSTCSGHSRQSVLGPLTDASPASEEPESLLEGLVGLGR